MDNEVSKLLDEAADELALRLYYESERHWENVIFERKHPQQTPFDLYVATYGKDTMDLINRLRNKACEYEEEE